jgi:phage terminase large subunit
VAGGILRCWREVHPDQGRRIEFAFIGLRHNLDSIKSKALIRLLWVDEAEPVSESAWMKAIPTVREDGRKSG